MRRSSPLTLISTLLFVFLPSPCSLLSCLSSSPPHPYVLSSPSSSSPSLTGGSSEWQRGRVVAEMDEESSEEEGEDEDGRVHFSHHTHTGGAPQHCSAPPAAEAECTELHAVETRAALSPLPSSPYPRPSLTYYSGVPSPSPHSSCGPCVSITLPTLLTPPPPLPASPP